MLSTIQHMSDRHTIQPYPLRLQPELRTALEQAAKQRGRSLHAEIVARLEDTMRPTSEMAQLLSRLEQIAAEKNLKLSLSIGTDLEDDEEEN